MDEIWAALEACPKGCISIVMGDLNANVGFPRDKREEIIVDLLDEFNFTESSRRFKLQAPRRFGLHIWFTWNRKWGRGRAGMRIYSTPDYFMVQEGGQSKVMRFILSSHDLNTIDLTSG